MPFRGFAKKTLLKTAQKAGFGKSSKTIVKSELTFTTAVQGQNLGSPSSALAPRIGHPNSTTLPSPTRRGTTGGLAIAGASAGGAGSDSDSEKMAGEYIYYARMTFSNAQRAPCCTGGQLRRRLRFQYICVPFFIIEKSESRAPFTRTLDRLSERSYCKDYQRLGLCTRAEVTLHSGNQSSTGSGSSTGVGINLSRSSESHFRLTVVNRTYSVCRT